MSRVSIDQSKCQGHARCVTRAPELFDVDDEGISFVLAEQVPPEHADAALAAAQTCPERAISVHE